jgi:phage shock protein PspC (stress-responsive transcriptional regulator)
MIKFNKIIYISYIIIIHVLLNLKTFNIILYIKKILRFILPEQQQTKREALYYERSF